MNTELQYPIGRFAPVTPITDAMRHAAVEEIAALPSRMRDAVAGLSDAQLDILARYQAEDELGQAMTRARMAWSQPASNGNPGTLPGK